MTQTLMVFPGVSVSMLKIPNIEDNWKVTTLNLIFNCFDTVGRYVTEVKIFNENIIFYSTFARFLQFIFFFIIILTTWPVIASF